MIPPKEFKKMLIQIIIISFVVGALSVLS